VVRAKRSLGQNFLVDGSVQAGIVAALDPQPQDEVLEIGPGQGALTRRLAGRVRRLRAVELDPDLAARLQEKLGDLPGIEIVHGNALDEAPTEWAEDPSALKIIGNIPYNITSPLIFWLLDQRPRPAVAVLMVQREVADRILAAPGTKAYGALSVAVRAAARVERVFHVGRRAFRPVPDVDSTVIRLRPYVPPLMSDAEERDLRALTRAAFGWRRKQLRTTLRQAAPYGLDPAELDRLEEETGIGLERRPETLDPEAALELSRALRRLGYPRNQQDDPEVRPE